MNSLFKRLSLPAKLLLLGLLPLVFMLFFAAQIHIEKSEKITLLDSLQLEVKRSATLMVVVDKIQIERRAAFTFLARNTGESEMIIKRSETDKSLEELTALSGSALQDFTSYTLVDSLRVYRQKIDEKAAAPLEIMSYYTNVISRLTSFSNTSVASIPFLKSLHADFAGQRILLQMASYLGLLRGHMYYNLLTKSDSTSLNDLRDNYIIYQTYVTELNKKAEPDIVLAYKQYRNTGNLQEVLDFYEKNFKQNSFDFGEDAERFRLVSAGGVDEIKALQRIVLQRVEKKMEVINQQEKSDKTENLIILILLIAFIITIVLYTIQNIAESLSELRDAAGKIALGATDLQLDVRSKDSIGNLARSIKEIDVKNVEFANAAREIGKGNFDVELKPRSSDDILGTSIVLMKENLDALVRQNKETIWVQTGITTINESIREEKDLSTLSKDALNAVVKYLEADVGVFYSFGQGRLTYVAGYAIESHIAKTEIHPGETLTGEAIFKKQIIHLRNAPPGLLKVSTSLGSAEIVNILIIPLVYNNLVEGVLEIGSIHPFEDAAIKLLEEVRVDLAIAMQSGKSRLRVQELLEETQSQAEELQVQHGELENLNTELEAQMQKLQSSEEELKVQQEELMHTNQELEERSRLLEEKNQLIAERNIEIHRKAEELALSTKYKSEFLANMSHELRTPLNSILLLSRLFSENTQKNLTPEQVEYADVIQSSGHGLLGLIDEILDLSKIEAGKMDLEYAPMNIQEFVDEIRSMFQPVANQKKLEFVVEISPEIPPTIETDKMRLGQIVKNLLSNAFKFTSTGSVILALKSDKGNNVLFSVKDTGIGIPKDKQLLIFEAFQQADGSTRRKYGGTGLGLSISRELVKLLGGELHVNSEPDRGSEFVVSVPKKKVEAAAPEKRRPIIHSPEKEPVVQNEEELVPEEPRIRFTSEKIPETVPDDRSNITDNDRVILIIEDDTSFAKALLNYTRNKGYKGVVAVRGDEGVELAQEYRPMGILLDLQLPVKDGWEVMEELKADPQTKHIPVHMMSSHEVKKESLIKGAVDFINKPVAFEQIKEIFDKIEHVISKQHKKVLIVEENSKHAKALAYFLENYSVSSEISGDVQDSVTALKKEDVDCVILDMGIPDQKAYETLDSIKKTPGLENLPIIIFTGKSLSNAEEQKIKRYADSIVIKTAHSYQRILDEVSLFLHLVEENKNSKEKTQFGNLGSLNEVLSGKTILIADDDIRNIYSLTKALENHKMNVIAALDGQEALRLLDEHPSVDIVLMDIMMPVLDGYETTKKIRRQNKLKNLPVIAVTAKAMTGDREKCIQAGASDYISKPVDIDQLLSLLRVWLYEKGSTNRN